MAVDQSSINSLAQKDRRYLWHHMSGYSETASRLIVTEANGSWVTDHTGKRYFDAMSGLWCVNVGYGRREMAQAAYEQLNAMPYYPLTQSHPPAIELAEKLSQWLGGDYVILFSNSGSEANETAFKAIRQYHAIKGKPSKTKFIARYRGYHGNSLGAMSATGQAVRKYQYEPAAGGFLHVSPPDSYRRPEGQTIEQFQLECALSIERTIVWEGEDTIAGIIMEPAITGGGIIVPHPIYMKKVQEICEKYGVLLVIDEVICGFGRTGKAFGHMHFDVKPDIVTMAKGLTSGYLPLSATAVRREIFEAFDESVPYGNFRHVNTFGGNPAACALALKNLEIMERENLIDRGRELGERLQEEMEEIRDHERVGDVRGFGFLMGIELVADKASKTPLTPDRIAQVVGYCKEHGVLIGKNGDTTPGFNNILQLCPPLTTSEDELLFVARTVKEAIRQLT